MLGNEHSLWTATSCTGCGVKMQLQAMLPCVYIPMPQAAGGVKLDVQCPQQGFCWERATHWDSHHKCHATVPAHGATCLIAGTRKWLLQQAVFSHLHIFSAKFSCFLNMLFNCFVPGGPPQCGTAGIRQPQSSSSMPPDCVAAEGAVGVEYVGRLVRTRSRGSRFTVAHTTTKIHAGGQHRYPEVGQQKMIGSPQSDVAIPISK
jgi:hypothetical protein